MNSTYDTRRGVHVCFVASAKKDNEVAKKGESYIWVQRTKFAPKEFFKDEAELAKTYPNHYNLSYNSIGKLVMGFKNFEGSLREYLEKSGFKK